VSQDRLTRQELSWLLAQEARGAAKALREGVAQLTQPPPGPAIVVTEASRPVETNLDALDDAISKLSALQIGAASKARRGRIDLAALLCEVAPNARIAMEPGAGTEVFGEEVELKRMLHLLISATNSSPAEAESAHSEVVIKREGDWVRISVELGPDSSATAEIERRWLSRMATRHGGKLELEAGTEALLLPADRAGDEVAELRKELEQAQQLGEAYARELAAVFSSAEMPSERSGSQLPPVGAERLELLVSIASAQVKSVRGWLDGLVSDLAAVSEALGPETELAQRHARRMAQAQEFAAELERLAQCSLTEQGRSIDLVNEIRTIVAAAEPRAARHDVRVELELPPSLQRLTQGSVFTLIVRTLLDHAIAATPRGGFVTLRLVPIAVGFELVVEDGGPVVPGPARADALRRRIDPSSVGRPEGLALLIADAAAPLLGGRIALGETPDGRSELSLSV
jgi:two-component system OmpR family sensor kinase